MYEALEFERMADGSIERRSPWYAVTLWTGELLRSPQDGLLSAELEGGDIRPGVRVTVGPEGDRARYTVRSYDWGRDEAVLVLDEVSGREPDG